MGLAIALLPKVSVLDAIGPYHLMEVHLCLR
jgi:hypothetical protein